jgi:hypothetical protein
MLIVDKSTTLEIWKYPSFKKYKTAEAVTLSLTSPHYWRKGFFAKVSAY